VTAKAVTGGRERISRAGQKLVVVSKVKKNKINASKLIDAILSDFFTELENQNKPKSDKQKLDTSFPTAL